MDQKRLPRVLSLFDVTIMASASMGPAFSIATTMGPMVGAAGTFAPLALVLLTAVMTCAAIGFWRMVRVYPNAGSSYSWIRSAFGDRFGSYGAWLLILSNLFAVLATALPAGVYTIDLFSPSSGGGSPLVEAVIGSVWIIAASVLLWAGLRPTSRVAIVMLLTEIAVLLVTAIAAFGHGPAASPAPSAPAAPIGLGGVFVAMAIAIWTVDGWEISASTSEENVGGRDTPGWGGIIGLLATALVLLICMVAYMRVGTVSGFNDHAEDAMAYVGAQLGSGAWGAMITIVVLISILVSLQTTLVYLTRGVFAMGRDGVLPPFIGELDRRGTPTWSIVSVAVIVIAFTLATGLWRSAHDAYNLVLNGSALFLGALFMCSTAAAARTFMREPSERFMGVVIPLAATISLAAILVIAFLQYDTPTRITIGICALLGVPLALWRSRVSVALAPEPERA